MYPNEKLIKLSPDLVCLYRPHLDHPQLLRNLKLQYGNCTVKIPAGTFLSETSFPLLFRLALRRLNSSARLQLAGLARGLSKEEAAIVQDTERALYRYSAEDAAETVADFLQDAGIGIVFRTLVQAALRAYFKKHIVGTAASKGDVCEHVRSKKD